MRDPCRRELDCQRQSVQTATDFGDRNRILLGQGKSRVTRAGPGHEERHSWNLGKVLQLELLDVRERERRDRILLLRANVHRLAAGSENRQLGTCGQQGGDVRRGVDHLLAVVQD